MAQRKPAPKKSAKKATGKASKASRTRNEPR